MLHKRGLPGDVRARKPQSGIGRGLHVASALATAVKAPSSMTGESRSHETDYVVIGSGIGGLSCAALLAHYGHKVTVVESHTTPGGACHTYERQGYHFESGPSLYSGMTARGKEANPLGHVLQAIGEPLECYKYNTWNVILPEGEFLTKVGNDNFATVLNEIRGPSAVTEWTELQEFMRPLAQASALMPPAAFRADPGVLITALVRYFPSLISSGGDAAKLIGPFSNIMEGKVNDPFIKNWLNLLCFLLSGLPANGTIAAEVAFMFNEWYRPDCFLEFPKGGSQALVSALIRGLEKFGGRIMCSSHVERVITEGGRATGVALRGGGVVRARKAVISSASVWDTVPLLPQELVPEKYRTQALATPACPSFMHLNIGFDGTGLSGVQREIHHIVVNSWDRGVDAEQNVVLISVPSMLDPSLAPEGKHTLHAYLPATEPYALWEGIDRNSEKYRQLKEERSQILWRAVEKVIPDIRQRAEISLVGTPLTHARFLRRHRGSYGPAIMAGQGTFPGPSTPIPGLFCCGDSTFPGIGLPAVAASGAICANTQASVAQHWAMLDAIGV